MAQDEPQAGDVIMEKDGRTFAIEKEVAEVVNFFEVDYIKNWLRKGFAVFANGSRGSC
jgi:Fe-S cluster assembly iron-binding protein IscA